MTPQENYMNNPCMQHEQEIDRLMTIQSNLLLFLEKVSRSACMDQRLSGKCICFSCEARKTIDFINLNYNS